MTNTDTADVPATLAQMAALSAAGCEMIRVAAYDVAAARAISKLKAGTDMPIVADVHFDYQIALAAIEAGADKIRINPGNIGSEQKIKCVADAAREREFPSGWGRTRARLPRSTAEKSAVGRWWKARFPTCVFWKSVGFTTLSSL